MVHEFTDWFEEEFGSLDFIDIIDVNKFDDGESKYMLKCGDIIIKSYEKKVHCVCNFLNPQTYGIKHMASFVAFIFYKNYIFIFQ